MESLSGSRPTTTWPGPALLPLPSSGSPPYVDALTRQLLHTACDCRDRGEQCDQDLGLVGPSPWVAILLFSIIRLPQICHVLFRSGETNPPDWRDLRLYSPKLGMDRKWTAEAYRSALITRRPLGYGTNHQVPYRASLFALAASPDLCTGGKTLHGKLIQLSVFFHTYSHFTSECDFS